MAYTEADTRAKLIDPQIKSSNWFESHIKQPFHFEGNMKPRYYQQIAVDKTLEAIANGKDRVLLTLATGKTYIAFQIVYRLFEAKWSKEMGSDKLSSLIKLSGMDMRELKEAFALDGVNTREGYFELQREIYR